MFTIIKQYIEQQNRPSDQEAARCAGRTNGIGFLPAVKRPGFGLGPSFRSRRHRLLRRGEPTLHGREIHQGPDAPVPQNSERIR